MAKTPLDVLPDLAQEMRVIVEWADRRERAIDRELDLGGSDRREANDAISVVTPAFSPSEVAATPAPTLISHAAEIEYRYRAAGWDEATIDLTTGLMSLKRFRRHVLVTMEGSTSDFRAPVFETETHQQAAQRILNDGFKYGMQGAEPGLLHISPRAIRYVRIPTRSY